MTTRKPVVAHTGTRYLEEATPRAFAALMDSYGAEYIYYVSADGQGMRATAATAPELYRFSAGYSSPRFSVCPSDNDLDYYYLELSVRDRFFARTIGTLRVKAVYPVIRQIIHDLISGDITRYARAKEVQK